MPSVDTVFERQVFFFVLYYIYYIYILDFFMLYYIYYIYILFFLCYIIFNIFIFIYIISGHLRLKVEIFSRGPLIDVILCVL